MAWHAIEKIGLDISNVKMLGTNTQNYKDDFKKPTLGLSSVT